MADPRSQYLFDPNQGVSPEAIRQIQAGNAAASGLEALAPQLTRADALRDTAGAQGRNYGRVYQAANPLEHLAVALRRSKGETQANQLAEQSAALRGAQVAGQAAEAQQAMQMAAYADSQRINAAEILRAQKVEDTTAARAAKRFDAGTVRGQQESDYRRDRNDVVTDDLRNRGYDTADAAQTQLWSEEDDLRTMESKLGEELRKASAATTKFDREVAVTEPIALVHRKTGEEISALPDGKGGWLNGKTPIKLEDYKPYQRASSKSLSTKDATGAEHREAIDVLRRQRNNWDNIYNAVEQGASTGPVDSFFHTVSDAGAQYDEAHGQLALERIGDYTFGSLSKAEGDWLKSATLSKDYQEEATQRISRHRSEGLRRAIAAEEYSLEAKESGMKPDSKVIEQIKFGVDPNDTRGANAGTFSWVNPPLGDDKTPQPAAAGWSIEEVK